MVTSYITVSHCKSLSPKRHHWIISSAIGNCHSITISQSINLTKSCQAERLFCLKTVMSRQHSLRLIRSIAPNLPINLPMHYDFNLIGSSTSSQTQQGIPLSPTNSVIRANSKGADAWTKCWKWPMFKNYQNFIWPSYIYSFQFYKWGKLYCFIRHSWTESDSERGPPIYWVSTQLHLTTKSVTSLQFHQLKMRH